MTESTDKNPGAAAPQDKSSGHGRVVAPLVAMVGLMVVVVVYSPELYNLFCKATGYGGTTQRVEVDSDVILDQEITVRFDGIVSSQLNWGFKPKQKKIRVRIGETVLVNYVASNKSDKATVGTAVYNVTPEIAGSYFNKIDCFCFTEQKLEAGETVEMPLSFYIDPEIVKDSSGRYLDEITLSYVFYAKSKPIKAAEVQR